jgi:hypothetical protein
LKSIFLNIHLTYLLKEIDEMDKPTRVVLMGMFIGLFLFIGFEVLTFAGIAPLGIPFNNFLTMIGVILFFIAGFFYLSLKTIKE